MFDLFGISSLFGLFVDSLEITFQPFILLILQLDGKDYPLDHFRIGELFSGECLLVFFLELTFEISKHTFHEVYLFTGKNRYQMLG